MKKNSFYSIFWWYSHFSWQPARRSRRPRRDPEQSLHCLLPLPSSTPASSAPTEETGGAAMTPTGAVESPASTQGAEGEQSSHKQGMVARSTHKPGRVTPVSRMIWMK